MSATPDGTRSMAQFNSPLGSIASDLNRWLRTAKSPESPRRERPEDIVLARANEFLGGAQSQLKPNIAVTPNTVSRRILERKLSQKSKAHLHSPLTSRKVSLNISSRGIVNITTSILPESSVKRKSPERTQAAHAPLEATTLTGRTYGGEWAPKKLGALRTMIKPNKAIRTVPLTKEAVNYNAVKAMAATGNTNKTTNVRPQTVGPAQMLTEMEGLATRLRAAATAETVETVERLEKLIMLTSSGVQWTDVRFKNLQEVVAEREVLVKDTIARLRSKDKAESQAMSGAFLEHSRSNSILLKELKNEREVREQLAVKLLAAREAPAHHLHRHVHVGTDGSIDIDEVEENDDEEASSALELQLAIQKNRNSELEQAKADVTADCVRQLVDAASMVSDLEARTLSAMETIKAQAETIKELENLGTGASSKEAAMQDELMNVYKRIAELSETLVEATNAEQSGKVSLLQKTQECAELEEANQRLGDCMESVSSRENAFKAAQERLSSQLRAVITERDNILQKNSTLAQDHSVMKSRMHDLERETKLMADEHEAELQKMDAQIEIEINAKSAQINQTGRRAESLAKDLTAQLQNAKDFIIELTDLTEEERSQHETDIAAYTGEIEKLRQRCVTADLAITCVQDDMERACLGHEVDRRRIKELHSTVSAEQKRSCEAEERLSAAKQELEGEIAAQKLAQMKAVTAAAISQDEAAATAASVLAAAVAMHDEMAVALRRTLQLAKEGHEKSIASSAEAAAAAAAAHADALESQKSLVRTAEEARAVEVAMLRKKVRELAESQEFRDAELESERTKLGKLESYIVRHGMTNINTIAPSVVDSGISRPLRAKVMGTFERSPIKTTAASASSEFIDALAIEEHNRAMAERMAKPRRSTQGISGVLRVTSPLSLTRSPARDAAGGGTGRAYGLPSRISAYSSESSRYSSESSTNSALDATISYDRMMAKSATDMINNATEISATMNKHSPTSMSTRNRTSSALKPRTARSNGFVASAGLSLRATEEVDALVNKYRF